MELSDSESFPGLRWYFLRTKRKIFGADGPARKKSKGRKQLFDDLCVPS
jgi:hypothetical protein